MPRHANSAKIVPPTRIEPNVSRCQDGDAALVWIELTPSGPHDLLRSL